MSLAAEKRATYQDVLDAPPRVVAEVIAGRLYTHPRPAPKHAVAHLGIAAKIGPPFHFGDGGPGGWLVVVDPELHLPAGAFDPDIVVPDLAGWRRERMPKLPETAFFEIAPDWACEILTPSTARLDRGEKRDVYAREGVAHLWLVDPIVRQLEVFELRDGRWALLATISGSEEVAVAPFAAVPFSLGSLWAD